MGDDLVGLVVSEVAVAVPAGIGVEAGMVTLQETEEPYRRLRLYVGQPEARAIRVAWRREVPPRPSTWDLFVSTLALVGARVDAAVISDVEQGRHWYAQMVLRTTGADERPPMVVTARPSDAIALALRADGAALWARRHVLDDAGIPGDPPPGSIDQRSPADGGLSSLPEPAGAFPGAEPDAGAEVFRSGASEVSGQPDPPGATPAHWAAPDGGHPAG